MSVNYIYVLKPVGDKPQVENNIVISANKLEDAAALLYKMGSNINLYTTTGIFPIKDVRFSSLKLLAGKVIKNEEKQKG